MSVVTNVIISYSLLEEEDSKGNSRMGPILTKLNEWLEERGCGSFLPALDAWGMGSDAIGGRKNLETPIHIAAFNYLDIEGFLYQVAQGNWEYIDDVQVMIQDQESDKFVLHNIGESDATIT